MLRNAIPMASAYAGVRVRQIKRDVILVAFVAVMALLSAMAMLGAFAAYIGQTHGAVVGLISAAGLTIALSIIAFVIRLMLRRRELRRKQIAASRTASALALTSVAGMASGKKSVAIVAGVTIGILAATLMRSGRD